MMFVSRRYQYATSINTIKWMTIFLLRAAIFGSGASNVEGTEHGEDYGRIYSFQSSIRLDEIVANTRQSEPDELAFRVSGELIVSTLWSGETHSKSVSRMQIQSLELFTKNKTRRSEFVKSKTPKLESAKNEIFLVQFDGHHVEEVYLHPEEEISIRNLKKAIANHFQFKSDHAHEVERDVCGVCQVTYEIIDKRTILKQKTNCKSQFIVDEHHKPIFDATNRTIERQVIYQLEKDTKLPARITSHDQVDIKLSAKQEIGVSVYSSLDIIFKEVRKSHIFAPSKHSMHEAIGEITIKLGLEPDALYLAQERTQTSHKLLHKVLNETSQFMVEGQLGTSGSAVAFIEVMKSVLHSSEDEITEVLKDKNNKSILNQLMDVLGCAQTLTAHNAVLKAFNFATVTDINPVERYLWALSVSRGQKKEIIRDFIEILNKKLTSKKLKETLVLTVAALASKFSQEKVTMDVYSLISKGIDRCKQGDEWCISMYLRALKNLNYPGAKTLLLHYAKTGSRVVSVTALKVLYSLPSTVWDKDVIQTAESIYYQKRRVYDSSARTIAADIIIDSSPDRPTLQHLLQSLQTNTSFEVRKYLLQRLQQTASANETFDTIFRDLLRREKLFNYDFFAQKGLSTALSRPILTSQDLNASIFTINEVSKSVLKRCHSSVSVQQLNETINVVSLDLFTSGLTSFLWSDDTYYGEEELDESEDLMAGVELSMYGVQMRPFIFFRGHGELVGHLFSGTATELTPIFQAMRLLQYTNDLLPLSSGNVISSQLTGSISFELAGQITFSIWNRNAHSFIEARPGIAIIGAIAVDTFYISQQKTFVKYKITRNQIVPETNEQGRRWKHKEYNLPGQTFQLNQKNNEMCNVILAPDRIS